MIYTLHSPQAQIGQGQDFDTLEAVPEKLAPFALIAPPLWLAWHRLWFALGVYVLVTLIIASLIASDVWPVALVLGGLPGLYLWLEGHQLRRNRLENLGYRLVEVIDARDEQTAIARYISHRFTVGDGTIA